MTSLGALSAPGESKPVGRQHSADEAHRYIVVYETPRGARSSRRVNVAAVTSSIERSYGFRTRHRYRHALKGFSATLTGREVARLRGDARIASISRERTFRALGRFGLIPGEAVPSGISRIEAANAAGVHQESTAAVAVIDTGIDLSNSELNASAGRSCVPGSPSPTDDHGHGTYVAGVIGARNSGASIVGVSPGTRMYAVKVLNSQGAGTGSALLCGIDWVTANAAALNIRVANLSLGGPTASSSCPTPSDPLHQAICNSAAAGVTYTVAAGNSGRNFGGRPIFDCNPPQQPCVVTPAAYPEVLTVAAASDTNGSPGGGGPTRPCLDEQGNPATSESDETAASFSDYAVSQADAAHVVAAPGVLIRSTTLGGQLVDECGTSAAAPHAAGVAALCMGEGGATGPCASMSSADVIRQIRADAAANATLANGFVGDPNHPQGNRYYGYMVSALDPSIRRIPLPPQAQPGPTAVDASVDLRRLSVRKVQDVDRLRVEATLGEEGTVTVRATVRIPAARRPPASASSGYPARQRQTAGWSCGPSSHAGRCAVSSASSGGAGRCGQGWWSWCWIAPETRSPSTAAFASDDNAAPRLERGHGRQRTAEADRRLAGVRARDAPPGPRSTAFAGVRHCCEGRR